MSETKIPVIEVGHLLNVSQSCELSGKHREAADSLRLAFEQYGVAYLRINDHNENMAENTVENVISAARQLLQLPESTKAHAVSRDNRPGIIRGFVPVGAESGSDLYELKEAFSYSYNWEDVEDEPSNALEARNVWPDECVARETLEQYYKLCGDIMAAISRALVMTIDDIDCDCDLERVVREGETIGVMRCIRYLCAAMTTERTRETGSVPHTDWGFATLIAQDANSKTALQVFYDGEYIDVPPLPGTLVANCGDYASVITGGRLRSPLHRVLLTDTERYSVCYFSYPAFSTPMPRNSAGVRGLSLYKNQAQEAVSIRDGVTFGQHIVHKWEQVQRDAV